MRYLAVAADHQQPARQPFVFDVVVKVPVQARSEAEYVAMLEKHGFRDVRTVRIPDRSPSPEVYTGKWFKDAEELKDFKRIGALLLIATK